MIKKELATMQAAIENLQEDILQTERDIERQGQKGCRSRLWGWGVLRGLSTVVGSAVTFTTG